MDSSLFSADKTLFGGDANEDTEINMIAFLSILSNMLFFLLASFGIAIISLVAANVPTVAEADEVFTVHKDKVIATITIDDEGFSVTAQNEMMTKEEAAGLEKKIPKNRDEYRFELLNEYLYKIKKKYKRSESVVITPIPTISYEVLIATMDAAREKKIIEEGKTLVYPLFPSAVISTLVK